MRAGRYERMERGQVFKLLTTGQRKEFVRGSVPATRQSK